MKRIISILISAAISLSGVLGFANPEYGEVSGTGYEKPANLLMNIGVMFPEEDTMFDAEKMFARADAVVAVMRVLGYDDITLPVANEEKSVFADVANDFWAVEDINAAYSLGIISPDENNCFRPGENITIVEFSKMLLCAFGYYAEANDKGGYPAGYLYLAAQMGLLDGISDKRENRSINKGEAALMLYNALDIQVRIPAAFSKDSIRLQNGGTVLKVCLGIVKEIGVVNADDVTALSGYDTVGENCVLIGDVICRTSEVMSAEGFLGHSVEFYYEQSDSNNYLKYITINDEIDCTIEISSNDEYSYSQVKRAYSIKSESGKVKDYETALGNDIIYNGKLHNRCPVESMSPKTGYVELIDNNMDGKYEVIKITEFTTEILSRYNETVNSMAFDGGSLMDLTNFEKINVYDKTGNVMTLSEIPIGAVLSIAASADGMICTFAICTDIIESTGDFLIKNDGKIKVSGIEYSVLENVYEKNPTGISPGEDGIFYLDFMGNIADFVSGSNLLRVGYLTKITKYGGFGDKYGVKIFTSDNRFNIYNLATKVVINDVFRKTDDKEFLLALGAADVKAVKAQLIRYRLNSEGEICFIETAQTYGDGLRITGENKTMKFLLSPLTLGGTYYTGNCGVFVIPYDKSNDELYRYTTALHLSDSTSYVFNAYEYDDDLRTDVLVCFNQSGDDGNSVSNADNLMMLDSCESMTDSDGNRFMKAIVYEACEKVEYDVRDENFMAVLASSKRGDIIQLKMGYDGYAVGLRKIYDNKNNEGMVYGNATVKNSIMCGYIVKNGGNVIRFVPCRNDIATHSEIAGYSDKVYGNYGLLSMPDLTEVGGVYRVDIDVMVYDSSLNEKSSCYRISADSISNIVENGKPQFAVMKASYGVPKSVFIIK